MNGQPYADTLVVPAAPDGPYLRVIPLGGCGEIGRNMTLLETRDDIIAVDCGLMFPDEEMFGVDIVINDFSYLRDRRDKLRGLLVTHGHEDHIGGIPYFLREFPRCPIVGTPLTLALIRAKLKEHKPGEVELVKVEPGDTVKYGAFSAEFIHINHSLAGACALAIRTPLGTIFHTGDFKFDQTPIDGDPADFASIARVGDAGVLCILSDSTNAERPGHTLSERIVGEAFANIFARASGRIIVTSFASNVPRIQQVIDQAKAVRSQGCVPRPFADQRRAVRERTQVSRYSRGADDQAQRGRGLPAGTRRRYDDRLAGRADVGAHAPLRARS